MKVDEIARIMQLYIMQNAYLGSSENNEVSSMFSVVLDKIIENMSKSEYVNDNTKNDYTKDIDKNINDAIKKVSEKYNIEDKLITAVIDVESSFNYKAVSKAGAQGLMQLMPSTQRELGVKNPFDVLDNIEGGTRYLRGLLDVFNGNKQLALAAYNGGLGRMKRLGVDTVEEIEKMPKETQEYVRKVMDLYQK